MRGALAGAPGVAMVGFDPSSDRFLVSGHADPADLALRAEGVVIAPRLRRWLERRRLHPDR